MKSRMLMTMYILCFMSVASASSEMVKDGWQCIKQCLWAILKVYIEDGIFAVFGNLAKIAWDYFGGLSNGNDWFVLQKAKDYLPYVLDILKRYSYINDVYHIWIQCTECL